MSNVSPILPTAVGHLRDLDPLSYAVAGFLARYKGGTLTEYRRDLQVFLGWCADQHVNPLQARRGELEFYVRWLEGRGLAQATVSRRFTTVAVFYKYLALDDLIAKDPAIGVARPKVDRAAQRRVYLTPLEFASLLESARAAGPVEHALVALLGMSGLRIAEACSLDVTSVSVLSGHDVIRFVGKGNKAALMPLPGPVRRAVVECIGERTEGPLLRSRSGARMDRCCAGRMLRRLAKAAHVREDVSPHALRRTFVTSGLTSGVPMRDVQIAARHENPATTAIYDMATGNLDRHGSIRIASFLAGMTPSMTA